MRTRAEFEFSKEVKGNVKKWMKERITCKGDTRTRRRRRKRLEKYKSKEHGGAGN